NRPDAERLLKRLETAIDLLECFVQFFAVGHLVQIAMMPDLVAGLEDSLADLPMRERCPSRREECASQGELIHQFEDLSYSNTPVVTPMRGGHHAIDIRGIVADPGRLGIDVEADEQGTFRPVRPDHIWGAWCRVERARRQVETHVNI